MLSLLMPEFEKILKIELVLRLLYAETKILFIVKKKKEVVKYL